MDELIAKNLKLRNDEIINIISEKIARDCPNSIDLFGVGGSFASGDFYEKSDLDLVLISRDDKAGCLDMCFILGDVGFDIYTQDWRSFEEAALYPNPFITKLIDLEIIKASEESIKHYKELQNQLNASMNDDEKIEQSIKKHSKSMTRAFEEMKEANEKGVIYRKLAEVLKYAEYIIYMSNKTYVKRGAKRIPSEIASMERLPKGFIEIYNHIISLSNVEEIKAESGALVKTIEDFLRFEVKPAATETKGEGKQKIDLKPRNIVGTYEEIYSNWYNKMIHAAETNNRYLSFVTMASCQEFYDEMFDEFNISKIELIGNYNPDDLNENTQNFELAMAEWKKHYDQFGIKIARFNSLSKFKEIYVSN